MQAFGGEQLVKPALTGAFAAAASNMLLGVSNNPIPFLGGEVGALAAIAATAAGASFVGEQAERQLPAQAQMLGAAANPVFTGAALAGLAYLTGMISLKGDSLLRVAALGAGSDVAAQYSWDNLVAPMWR